MPEPIAAQLLIHPAALARLQPSGADAALLAEVRDLMRDVRDRLNEDAQVLIDQREAARRLGVCQRTLTDLDVPRVRVGSRVMFRPAALNEWAKRNEGPASPTPRLQAAG